MSTKRSTTKTSAKQKEPATRGAKPRSRRAVTQEDVVAPEEDAPSRSTRARAKTTKKIVEPEAPPKPTYDLNGPIPPEGEKYSPKIGALLGVGQRALGIKEF